MILLFQVAQGITSSQLAKELEVVEQQLEAAGKPSQNRDRSGRSKTVPIDQFLKRPSAPSQYAPRSDLQKMVDIQIALFIATANLAFNLVEQPAFKRFVQALNPRALVKSKTTYSRNTIVLVWKNLKEQLDRLLSKELPGVTLISMTSDLWQSKATDDYISLTLHYVDEMWSMRHFNVECRPYSLTHSGVLIGQTLDTMINAVTGLSKDTMKIMTTDGAANMRKACEESEEVDAQLICLCHVINLAYKDAAKVPAIASCIKMCKDLASACHYSTKRNNAIRAKCEEMSGKLMT